MLDFTEADKCFQKHNFQKIHITYIAVKTETPIKTGLSCVALHRDRQQTQIYQMTTIILVFNFSWPSFLSLV